MMTNKKNIVILLLQKDQLKEDLRKNRRISNVSEEDSSANDNIYTRQHKVTSEDNDDITEEKSSSEEDKKEKVTEEGNNISEINNNAEVNKEKNEDNTSEDASNKPDQDQNFTETGEIKSRNQIEITNESNEDSVLVETKIEDGNEKMSTISELDVPENDKETSSENEDNALQKQINIQKRKRTLKDEKKMAKIKQIQKKNLRVPEVIMNIKMITIKKKSHQKIMIRLNLKEYHTGKKIFHNRLQKQKIIPKERLLRRLRNFKSSKREEYLNHSTEPNESHSSHIIMEVTSVVIKTVEDLLYAHRNTSRHYAPRTTVDLNDTEILLTPKPKFGKMGRTMADHAGGRTQHTILHCLL
ncbi:hypothetical protein EVAR_18008_1 [Eumeta japonica]|uniref:Uncharacterized protein n=1 Tax=Eumeta variegata TaxID=151549 RepID=A0A4C1Y9S7_EUMVA|nr:hypothetical protein EVAR_18008_1 [Eumeta japonica]